jgi:hypothetical protein
MYGGGRLGDWGKFIYLVGIWGDKLFFFYFILFDE